MQEQKQTLTQEASVIYACRAIVGRDTPAILIVNGIPGGWSLVWNERFTIVWFSPSVRGSHVFGGLAWATDCTGNQWLVNSLKWLAFQWYTEIQREWLERLVHSLRQGIPQSSVNGQARHT